jgi:hypothetical protein
MKLVLKLEELAMFLACNFSLHLIHAEWWWFVVMFIGPDISMLGYMFNNKIGAFSYNLFHHKGIGLVVLFFGFFYKIWLMQVIGTIIFGHASLDRFVGFGLKFENGFKFTHLGEIGKK